MKVFAYLMSVEYSNEFKIAFPTQSHLELKLKFPDPKPSKYIIIVIDSLQIF